MSGLLEIPGIAGLKFTHSDLFLLSRLLLRRPNATIFNGSDEMVAPGLMYGARGGIGTWYNLVPRVFVEIWQAFRQGDLAGATDIQVRFNRLADVAWEFGILSSFDMLMRRAGLAPHVWRRPFRPFNKRERTEAWRRLRPHCRALGLSL